MTPEANTVDRARIAAAVSEILAAIGEDPARPGLIDTPGRVADAYAEFCAGVGVDPLSLLADPIPADTAVPRDADPGPADAGPADAGRADAGPRDPALGDLVLMRDIDFRSLCEHHLVPFTGRAHIAYQPGDRLVGLGRLPRMIDTLASRPQLQERLTEQIADAMHVGLEPRGVLVVMEATHQCVTARGPRQARSSTVTVASRGTLSEATERAGVLAMIGRTDDRDD